MAITNFSKYFLLDLDAKTIPAEGGMQDIKPVFNKLKEEGKNLLVVHGSRSMKRHWRGPDPEPAPPAKKAGKKSSSTKGA